MQRNEITKKVEQIEKVSKSPEALTQNISDVIDKFEIRDILKNLDMIKRSGALLSTMYMALLILPFAGMSSVLALFKSGLNKAGEGGKDAYYEAKNNENVSWRLLLASIAKRFVYLVGNDKEGLSEKINTVKALIIDDSTLQKTGKSIEGIGYVHDHVTNFFVLGYKLLVIGFWDGRSFIPIDFSIHKEPRDSELKTAGERVKKIKEKIKVAHQLIKEAKARIKTRKSLLNQARATYDGNPTKTNKTDLDRKQRGQARAETGLSQAKERLKSLNEKAVCHENKLAELKENYRHCGLRKKDIKNQYKKKREMGTPGHTRKKETGQRKSDTAIKMLKRAIRNGFVPDYVLTDSWFFSHTFLKAVIGIGRNVHLISMAKIGLAKYTLLPTGATLNPHQILVRHERKSTKTSRKYKSKYLQFQASYQGERVKIFLIKFGRNNTWRMLVTTELEISFAKLMEVYKIRWAIEVFFKECKQNLLLGKCQSNDFDAQIADTTLCMIRYILLSYCERIRYGTTIGGLFRELRQAAIEDNLLADMSSYFFELLKIFADMASIDFIGFYEELLRNPQAEILLEGIGLGHDKNIFKEVA